MLGITSGGFQEALAMQGAGGTGSIGNDELPP